MKSLAATLFCVALGFASFSACDDGDDKPAGNADAAVPGAGGAGGVAAGGAGGTAGTPGGTGGAAGSDAGTTGDTPAADTGGGGDEQTVHLSIINAAPAAGVTALDVPASTPAAYPACLQ